MYVVFRSTPRTPFGCQGIQAPNGNTFKGMRLSIEEILKAPGLFTYVYIYQSTYLFKTKLSDFFCKRNITFYFLMLLELVKK